MLATSRSTRKPGESTAKEGEAEQASRSPHLRQDTKPGSPFLSPCIVEFSVTSFHSFKLRHHPIFVSILGYLLTLTSALAQSLFARTDFVKQHDWNDLIALPSQYSLTTDLRKQTLSQQTAQAALSVQIKSLLSSRMGVASCFISVLVREREQVGPSGSFPSPCTW